MTRWRHARKGVIEGRIIAEAGEWVDIQLGKDHELNYGSVSLRGIVDLEGEILTVRKSFLTELPEETP
jgi:hypothetical protein